MKIGKLYKVKLRKKQEYIQIFLKYYHYGVPRIGHLVDNDIFLLLEEKKGNDLLPDSEYMEYKILYKDLVGCILGSSNIFEEI